MNILHIGNGANLPYICVKRLRERGINSNHLFIEQHITNHPLWTEIDTDIAEVKKEGNGSNIQQEWINRYRCRLPTWVHTITPDSSSNPYKQPRIHWNIINKINNIDADVIHAWNIYSAIWASFSNTPYIYHMTGHYDWKWEWRANNPILKNTLRILMKRAVSKAAIVAGPPNVLEKFELRYNNAKTYPAGPIYDNKLFQPSGSKMKQESGIELFAGAAHRWELKKNNIIFEALADLDGDNIHLTTIEWGNDIDRSKKLVSELEIEKLVSFSPLMSKPRLARMIQSADAVLDQFNFGYGSLARQSLACGTPLISEIDLTRWKEAPPILRASTSHEIIQQIDKVREQGNKIGNESATWMQKYNNSDEIIDEYIRLYKSIS